MASTALKAAATDSGLDVILHPLPILNISEHSTRNRYADGKKAIGALLGTQKGREVSIVNSFELVVVALTPSTGGAGGGGDSADVDMEQAESTTGGGGGEPMTTNAEAGPSSSSSSGSISTRAGGLRGKSSAPAARNQISEEFLERRRQQYKETFPTLELVGWYSTGDAPDVNDVHMQHQLGKIIETPLFLLYSDSDSVSTSGSDLPITIYETALGESAAAAVDPSSSTPIDPGSSATAADSGGGGLVRLDYKIETGEAERIAVEGAATATTGAGGSMGGDESGNSLIASLMTQRDAIRMLHDRMRVLLEYVSGVVQGQAKPDHAILREIGSIVSSLPAMNDARFQEEYMTEYNDVQLTSYLSSLTRSLATLSDLTDKFTAIHQIDEFGGGGGVGSGGPGLGMGGGKGRLGGAGKWRS